MMKCLLGFVAVLTASLSLAANAASRRLVIDHDASSVTFFVRATVDSFEGAVENWTAELTVPEDSSLPDSAVFSAKLGDLKTGKDARNREMLRWLDDDRFPGLEYQLVGFNQSDDGRTRAAGQLTFHGVTQPITIPITATATDGNYTVRGEVNVDYRDFGLKIFRKFAILSVRPEVKVSFTIVGTLQ